MGLQSNPQLELAYEYVCYTNKCIFLTGRAGTGKTTFLHRIKDEAVKRMIVVAPTGVAAINAGGMTIHSFFQLPFGPYLPGSARETVRQRKFSGKKIKLIRSLELLVIDEISMVRADLLDGIDDVLRRYKNPYLPFGGVQLLMIGDLHQLPPVVKDEEWYLLQEHYETPYFFGSRALQQTEPVVVELKQIFRQSDTTFIDLLNRVRDNRLDANVLETLNSRYDPNFQPGEADGYITLTTHNASAQEINARKLAAIDEPVRQFKASISGEFPTYAYPTEEVLELKTGAQVMFVKNDPSYEKRYYNGKIGKITRITKDTIYVRCPDDEEDITVEQLDWENVKYSLNEATREVSEDIIGTFTQYPLKLAWAITIHKSQGLTFERVILDAQAAFAHGQVYVALSRCKSFEGIVLCSKINYSSVRTDARVRQFSVEAERNAPNPADLHQAKRAFQQNQILELFTFGGIKKALEHLNRVFLEHEQKLHSGAIQQFNGLAQQVRTELLGVGEKFCGQLLRLFQQSGLPEEDEEVQERIRKAATWFTEKLDNQFWPAVRNIQVIADNRKIRTMAEEALEQFQKEIFIDKNCMAGAQTGFSTQDYLRVKVNAELDFPAALRQSGPSREAAAVPSDTPHPELFARLLRWRGETAEEQDVVPYMVLPTQSLVELVALLPMSSAGLKKVSGIGKGRIKQYGAELLSIIQDYCTRHNLQSPVEEHLAIQHAPKPDSKSISFDLYRSGKSIDEIAAERGLVRSTIENHLTHFISLGELSIFDLVEPAKVETISRFFTATTVDTLTEAKNLLGEEFSYGEIRMVREYMKTQDEGGE